MPTSRGSQSGKPSSGRFLFRAVASCAFLLAVSARLYDRFATVDHRTLTAPASAEDAPLPAARAVPPVALPQETLHDAGVQAPTAAAGDPSVDAVETARIQGYLDARYKRSDVVSSFRTKFGEDIDCVDFYAQPAVKAMMARGQKPPIVYASELPGAVGPLPEINSGPLADVAFNGQPDENGAPRKCFGASVPMVRHTVAQIKAAGGLNAYLKRRARKPPPPMPVVPNPAAPTDDPGYMHVVAQLGDGGAPIYVGSTVTSIYQPKLGDAGTHSLSQTWLITGSKFAPCSDNIPQGSCVQAFGGQCYQTIEVGWTVAPDLNNGDAAPHIFVFSTQDGYWSTGSYNSEPGAPEACWYNAVQAGRPGLPQSAEPCNGFLNDGQLVPSPFVMASNAAFTPDQALPVSVVGATPVEIGFQTVDFFGLWSIGITLNNQGSPMGYYPADTWDGGVYADMNGGFAPPGIETSTGAPMNNGGQIFQAGGEVSGPTGPENEYGLTLVPFTLSTPGGNPADMQMGSGIGGAIGYKASAYHRNIAISVLRNGTLISPPFTPVGIGNPIKATDMNCYSYGFGLADGGPQTVQLQNLGYTFLQDQPGNPSSYLSPAPGGSGWGNYLYFGGLGNASGWPFSMSDPNGGTYDFCCSTVTQNGVGSDQQCPNSTNPNVCP
ncbi:MAG: neprosin family prolyl endopeptidase [Polyangiaceae bacterium]